MAFSEERLVTKLNGLDETQDSIVGASRWLLSQHKEIKQIAACWSKFVTKTTINTRRKLLAIYLANDVVQQAKHKRMAEVGAAFGDIMPGALSRVYPELSLEMRQKVRRVVDIWKQRQVFSDSVLKSVYSQLKDEPRPDSPAVAPEMQNLVVLFNQLTKSQAGVNSSKTRFDSSVEALDPSSAVYTENYKIIQKIGQAAKDALQISLDIRQKAIKELKVMLDFQNEQLQQDQNMISEVDAVLVAKDPLNSQPLSAEEAEMVPVYEASDGSDSDTDKSDVEGNDTRRRKSSTLSTEHKDDVKRLKSIAVEPKSDTGERADTFDAATYEPTPAEVAANSPMAVTSSIQDLLSKLAS
ncbi:LAME_0H09846g1_1 [Lachancea meyersii CBS 8951]|uniref:LAME_0H09846g1_1 n=1 Tax=Lachancea meyersii CBS 8951 TaxID=1266667 RepID=A0A1G4KG05_9SACH|nr:LAME_0H09846g1_1 [Lachancea meyersii CBS 8951]